MKSNRIKLVSFAAGAFANRRREFERQANAMAIFDEIQVFDETTLDAGFSFRHSRFINANSRGFGYWIWKPQVISQVLACSADGDIIVYMDAGFTLNPAGRPRFLEYLELAQDSAWKMLSFQNTHTEYKWTKMDLAIRLGGGDLVQMMNTSQLASGFVILGRTESNRDIIHQWGAVAVESNYHYSDDTPSLHPNHPRFIEHRHDASIFSLLRKTRGTAVTHYEVQPYGHFDGEKSMLPAWATRLRV